MGRGFQVWELKNRPSRDEKLRRDWQLGVRPGPNASGLSPQMVPDSDATAPGIREAGFREVVEGLRCPGQAGYPPSVATDAQLGFSVMAYQSAEVLFDRCEGDGHILVRPTGTCARAHKWGQGELAHRAKVGHCPSCARPTHVAALSRYMAEEYSVRKACGIQLRREFGPWAVRFFAAAASARDNGCRSSA